MNIILLLWSILALATSSSTSTLPDISVHSAQGDAKDVTLQPRSLNKTGATPPEYVPRENNRDSYDNMRLEVLFSIHMSPCLYEIRL